MITEQWIQAADRHTIIASIERCGDVIVLIGAINLRWMDSCMHRRGHAGWHTSQRLVWLHNHLRFFLSKLCWLGVRKVLFLWDVNDHHGDRLLSTWLRMEIITHSGPVTLLVGRDGGRKRLAFKGSFEVSFHEVLFMIAIHTGVHQLCRVGKIKNSGVFQPLQWLNTRMIEDDKSHVSTGSKNLLSLFSRISIS